jgi:transcription elongation factor GreB
VHTIRANKEFTMKTNLVTREGYLQLQQEHDQLWNVKRPEVTKIVSWAASLGDRSENADTQLEPLQTY